MNPSVLTHMPIVPGHALVCPIRIVETCEQLSHEEWIEILNLKRQICKALKKVFHAEGFNFAWNVGENAGQLFLIFICILFLGNQEMQAYYSMNSEYSCIDQGAEPFLLRRTPTNSGTSQE